MSRHATVAALVRRTCPDADELLEMLGVTEGGVMQPDPVLEPIVFVQVAPKVGKRAQIEHPHAMDARPKVSTAPEALRNLAPVEVPVKAAKAKPKPVKATPAAPKPKRVGVGRYTAPHGTYTALRRHRRLGEDPCDLCVNAKSEDPNAKARYTARRRELGIQPRELKPHGTEGAYRRHIKQKTPVCDACRVAHRQRNRELEAAKREAA